MDLDILKDIVAIFQSLATIVTLSLGGLWTYYHFVRGRTYVPRLEVDVKGKVAVAAGTKCVQVYLQVTNVGFSRVSLIQKGSGLIFSAYPKQHYRPVVHQAIWGEPTVFPILEKHRWIEPKECIEEKMLIAIPQTDNVAWRLIAILVTKKRFYSKPLEWSTVDIVFNQDEGDEHRNGG